MKPPVTPPNLRDRQREETREHILRAVGHQLEQGPLEDLSFAEIAKDAKVGERTVYRYFPTKEALLGAFWAWMQSQAVAPPEPKPGPRPARSLRTSVNVSSGISARRWAIHPTSAVNFERWSPPIGKAE